MVNEKIKPCGYADTGFLRTCCPDCKKIKETEDDVVDVAPFTWIDK